MLLIPTEFILAINAALLLITGILTVLLLRTGVHYVHSVGDSPVQEKQKELILVLIMLLFMISLLAAAFNILISALK
jgi:hypothetical protein